MPGKMTARNTLLVGVEGGENTREDREGRSEAHLCVDPEATGAMGGYCKLSEVLC